jgi:hypothetical protein
MKKTFIVLIILLIINSVRLNAFDGGNGTENNPYQIRTKAHLELLADSVNTIGLPTP